VQIKTRGPTRYTKSGAQEKVLSLLAQGYTVTKACELAGRTLKSYEGWRRDDVNFRKRADQARALRKIAAEDRGEKLDFAQWRRKYLHTETFWHQLQWTDMLEGKPPRSIHESQKFVPGNPNRILINCPPFHAKSMTLTVDYVVYRLCMDPGFRVVICSETSRLAKDFLFGIKQRLTHPNYVQLQKAYAPEGGWHATADQWAKDRIYLGGDLRDPEEKDPNVQALGIGQQIYGSRADMVILDDAITGKNCNMWEDQLAWLRRDVSSRIELNGKLVVVGTRVAPIDLYSQMLNPEHYANGVVPWTYLASPAILEEGSTPDEHITLWPYSDRSWSGPNAEDACMCGQSSCADGFLDPEGIRLFPRWDGLHLENGPRAENNARGWALIYQQESIAEDAIFPMHALEKATNPKRKVGLLKKDTLGHPPGGMHNTYVIGGCDPSIRNWAGLVVLAVDRDSGKRYLLAVRNPKAPTPDQLNQHMRDLTVQYNINEWRVERTGLLQFFTQNNEWRQWYTTRGVIFKEHHTGINKWDPAYGVASMAPLFGVYDKTTESHARDIGEWRCVQEPLLELPSTRDPAVRTLVNELVVWSPENDPDKVKCDLVMALWFAELRAREVARRASQHVDPMKHARKFVGQRAARSRFKLNLVEAREYEQA